MPLSELVSVLFVRYAVGCFRHDYETATQFRYTLDGMKGLTIAPYIVAPPGLRRPSPPATLQLISAKGAAAELRAQLDLSQSAAAEQRLRAEAAEDATRIAINMKQAAEHMAHQAKHVAHQAEERERLADERARAAEVRVPCLCLCPTNSTRSKS